MCCCRSDRNVEHLYVLIKFINNENLIMQASLERYTKNVSHFIETLKFSVFVMEGKTTFMAAFI